MGGVLVKKSPKEFYTDVENYLWDEDHFIVVKSQD